MSFTINRHAIHQSVLWNLFLLTSGSFLFTLGAQGIIAPHGFLTGGLYGSGILLWYTTKILSPAIWFGLISIPLFIVAFFHVSRRFFFYTLYAAAASVVFGQFVHITIPIESNFYAAVMAGVVCGTGAGLQLRSLGSGGALDAIGVVLNRKWNIGVGKFGFCFNAVLFTLAGWNIQLDMVIVSFIQVFISANVLEYVLRLFNQRKLVYVVTDQGKALTEGIVNRGYGGATVLKAKGGYSGDPREIILTVTNNILLRKLEALVYEIDPKALFIVENTFYVSGSKYPRKEVI